ncbi:MAG: hypothetical protein DRM99_05325, partial [Thermoplasmata archaeon]
IMQKKLIGIFICSLFITSVFSSISVGQNNAEITFIDEESSALDLLSPTVEITSPDDGSEVTNPYIVVEGYAASEIYMAYWEWLWEWEDGSQTGEEEIDPTGYYEFSIDIGPLAPGANTITVTFYDVEGGSGSDSVTVYYVPEDNDPPEVAITYPEDGMVFSEADITLLGYGSDNVGITAIGYKQEWEGGSSDTDAQDVDPPVEYMDFERDVTLHEGWNRLTVYMYDAAGNKGYDTVFVTKVNCEVNKPKITDNSGKTKFYGLFVGCNYKGEEYELDGAENAAKAMYEKLKGKKGWNESRMKKLIGNEATKANIREWINKFKDGKDNPPDPQPGDEFLFFFSGHGHNTTRDNREPGENGYDETILGANGWDISDDDLRGMISGFPECVTITVKIDACHSGGFKDGKDDVQNATNDQHKKYGSNKLNIETSCGADEEVYEEAYFWEDKNHDGIATPDEYVRKLGIPSSCDTNHNGQQDPGETWKWWNDKNGNGNVDNGELLPWDSNNVSFMTPFVKGQLEALEKKSGYFHPDDDYLNGDRNNDGIITTREWYEYAIDHIYKAFEGDNDGDGAVDEDGGEYDTSNGFNVKIYVDNDGDGFINEDPGPPSSAFWPNKKPGKPSRPEGATKGKVNEVYSYSSKTEDLDLDDVFYLFDWGDGTTSGWLGPYSSGEKCTAQHSWSKKGSYQIKVKARDLLYAESSWSESLSISMPRSKEIYQIHHPLLRFLQQHPQLFQLFQRFFNYIFLSMLVK